MVNSYLNISTQGPREECSKGLNVCKCQSGLELIQSCDQYHYSFCFPVLCWQPGGPSVILLHKEVSRHSNLSVFDLHTPWVFPNFKTQSFIAYAFLKLTPLVRKMFKKKITELHTLNVRALSGRAGSLGLIFLFRKPRNQRTKFNALGMTIVQSNNNPAFLGPLSLQLQFMPETGRQVKNQHLDSVIVEGKWPLVVCDLQLDSLAPALFPHENEKFQDRLWRNGLLQEGAIRQEIHQKKSRSLFLKLNGNFTCV